MNKNPFQPESLRFAFTEEAVQKELDLAQKRLAESAEPDVGVEEQPESNIVKMVRHADEQKELQGMYPGRKEPNE
jgi:hypothetical protein